MSSWTYTDHVDVPDSSSIDLMWYNENTQELAVEYQSGITVYGWRGVPKAVWDELKRQTAIQGGSVGQYHVNNVKGKYGSFSPQENDEGDFTRVSIQSAVSTVPSQEHNYTITGTRAFSVDVRAFSMDDAVQKVRNAVAEAKIATVSVNFDE